MSDREFSTQQTPALRWRTYTKANDHFKAAMGLFRDGVMAAHYQPFETYITVSEHIDGSPRVARQVNVSSIRRAREVCREMALGTFPAAQPATDEGAER